MPCLTELIGERFENILQADFPEFERNRNYSLLPDFSTENFYIEAKTGCIRCSIAPKKYQIDRFRNFPKPVAYCIGFHNFENAGTRLIGKSIKKIRETLASEMNIELAYFISQEIISKMFQKESRLNGKKTIHYCALKQRNITQLIKNKPFLRKGNIITPDEYYELDTNEFIIGEPTEKISSFPYGYMLNKEKDKEIIDFLKDKKIII